MSTKLGVTENFVSSLYLLLIYIYIYKLFQLFLPYACGTFEKRAPGHSSDFSVLKFVKYFCFRCCSYCRRFRVLKIAVTGGDVSMILLIHNTHANSRSLTMESTAKMLEVNTVVIKTIFVDG